MEQSLLLFIMLLDASRVPQARLRKFVQQTDVDVGVFASYPTLKDRMIYKEYHKRKICSNIYSSC